jgi:AcrR family transcriptional regulator
MQERNCGKVLAAARDEFAERGFRDAKVDAIAERAELTRGAVYSNFPSKRALYFAVMAHLAETAPEPPHAEPGLTVREALGAFARAWVTKLPLVDAQPADARLLMDLLPEIIAEDHTRRAYAQLTRLNAILLGLALETLRPGGRLVRVAEAVLTTLHGASQLAAAAPGFLEPFNVISACEQLAELDLNDGWPTLPYLTQARTVDEPWTPPQAPDLVRGESAQLADGLVAILGMHRLEAAEEAVRSAPPAARVTAVMVTNRPDELAPLARLVVGDFASCLRQAFPASAWPRLQVVCDSTGALAAAAGVPAVSDVTETAVLTSPTRVVRRSDGRGAAAVLRELDVLAVDTPVLTTKTSSSRRLSGG